MIQKSIYLKKSNAMKNKTFTLFVLACLFFNTSSNAQQILCGPDCPEQLNVPEANVGLIFLYQPPLADYICEYDHTGACLGGTVLFSLPVEFSNFEASLDERNVVLKWKTLSETNNEYFEVLRSADGKDFQSIGEVNGQGTTLETTEYAFVDKNAIAGDNYYMIRQVDFDGKYTVSLLQTVNVPKTKKLELSNIIRSGDDLDVSFNAIEEGTYTLQVFNLMGQEVTSQSIYVQEGQNEVHFNIPTKGLFVFTIANEADRLTEKIMK